MSKIIFACFRNNKISPAVTDKILSITEEMNPDNISPRPSFIHSSDRFIYGINNPGTNLETDDTNVLLGTLFSGHDKWNKPGAGVPDGNFVIFRTNKDLLEIITDCMATKTIWYYFDQEKLVASTSQKAIIRFIGDFSFDERVIPWIISTGSLGPSYSWDRRLKRVPADGKISLHIKKWEIIEDYQAVEFNIKNEPKETHKSRLAHALQETFANLNLNHRTSCVTLSGGHDSRAILMMINNFRTTKQRIKTITWGEKESLKKKRSDATIAQLLSKKLNTDHKYFFTENDQETIDKIMDRFLVNGEGRIDHITGYMDGFDLWKQLYEDSIECVVRGDEVFGYSKVLSSLMVKQVVGLTLCSDYKNLEKYEYIQNLTQQIPSILQKGSDESYALWRDRLYHSHRVPVLMSSLADLKHSYVEQVNPFLSKKIVMTTRVMPDHLRTDKNLFKEIMHPLDPGIPFANKRSNAALKDVTRRKDVVAMITKELSTQYAQNIFPEEFINQVIRNLKTEATTKPLKARIKEKFPIQIKRYFAKHKPYLTMDDNLLALRLFIIIRMHRILSQE